MDVYTREKCVPEVLRAEKMRCCVECALEEENRHRRALFNTAFNGNPALYPWHWLNCQENEGLMSFRICHSRRVVTKVLTFLIASTKHLRVGLYALVFLGKPDGHAHKLTLPACGGGMS